jgi:hypothetical protein
VCVYESTDTSSVEDGILRLLETLPTDVQLWVSLTSKFRVDLFCGVFLKDANRGFELSPAVLAETAKRGVILAFDIYCIGREE